MLNRNYYKSITESIVKAYRDNNLDSAVEQGEDMDNMGKKIVAIITADPDQDLDWSSEYQPFGATEIEYDDECDGEDCENDTCPSCGTDVDGHIVSDDEDDDSEENDDMEDIMIGGGFEDEVEDDLEDMDVKDILIDILNELRGEDGEENEDDFETSDDNPMFGGSDDEESDDEWEDEDDDSMLVPQDDWSSDESDDDDEQDDKFDDEEDNEVLADENGVEMEDVDGMLTASQDEEEVEILDCLDNA